MRQINKTQRRLAAGAFLLVAAPVALGSVAYACGGLVTLHANPSSAVPGGTVTLFGKGYDAGASSSLVELRMDDRTGPVIKSFAQPALGVLDVLFTLPADTAVGTHTLITTQRNSSGSELSGGPGRATVTVTAAPTSGRVGSTSGDQATVVAPSAAPTAAVPVGSAPAAAQAVVAPAAAASAGLAASTGSAAPTASVIAPSPAPNAAAPAADLASPTVAPSVASTDSAAAAEAPAIGTVNSVGFLPVASDGSSNLPSLVLAGGLALVLLSLAAFFKSGRNVLGRRGFSPLAG